VLGLGGAGLPGGARPAGRPRAASVRSGGNRRHDRVPGHARGGAAAVGVPLPGEAGVLAAAAAGLDFAHGPVRVADGAGGAAHARGLKPPPADCSRQAPEKQRRRIHTPTAPAFEEDDNRRIAGAAVVSLPGTRGTAMAYFKLRLPQEINTYGFD